MGCLLGSDRSYDGTACAGREHPKLTGAEDTPGAIFFWVACLEYFARFNKLLRRSLAVERRIFLAEVRGFESRRRSQQSSASLMEQHHHSKGRLLAGGPHSFSTDNSAVIDRPLRQKRYR